MSALSFFTPKKATFNLSKRGCGSHMEGRQKQTDRHTHTKDPKTHNTHKTLNKAHFHRRPPSLNHAGRQPHHCTTRAACDSGADDATNATHRDRPIVAWRAKHTAPHQCVILGFFVNFWYASRCDRPCVYRHPNSLLNDFRHKDCQCVNIFCCLFEEAKTYAKALVKYV